MLADLAGGDPRLCCISDNGDAESYVAICSAAGYFHEPDAAHALPLLVPAQTEVSLGSLGARLPCRHLNNVYNDAAHLPRLARGPEGTKTKQSVMATHEARVHYTWLCLPLNWHLLGYQSLAEDAEIVRLSQQHRR